MKRLFKWGLWLVAGMASLVIILLVPVIYVETLCRGNGSPQTYQALLAPQHHRSETRTLMTYPEWHIVHAYEDYAQVISTGAPHQYGFFRSIFGFWSSLCALSKASVSLGDIDTQTKQMIYVIGVSFSLELSMKAFYEETLGRLFVWLRGPNRAPLDQLSAQQAFEYAKFLQQTPWYKWRFRADAQELSTQATGQLRDYERKVALGIEYRVKAAYAGLIAQAVASTGADQLTLRMVIAGKDTAMVEALGDVTVIEVIPEGIVIEVPRYRALTHLLQKMADADLDFIEIAGNDNILFTMISDQDAYTPAMMSLPRQGFGDHRHLVLTDVVDLAKQLRTLKTSGMRLEHIHDY